MTQFECHRGDGPQLAQERWKRMSTTLLSKIMCNMIDCSEQIKEITDKWSNIKKWEIQKERKERE